MQELVRFTLDTLVCMYVCMYVCISVLLLGTRAGVVLKCHLQLENSSIG